MHSNIKSILEVGLVLQYIRLIIKDDKEIVHSSTWGIFIWYTAYIIVIQWKMTLCFIESQWNMMKMPHVRDCAISILFQL